MLFNESVRCIGALVVMIAWGLIAPQICDNRAASSTSRWESELLFIKFGIEENILKNGSVINSGRLIESKKRFSDISRIAFIKITDSGVIIIKGENRGYMTGQLMVLLPELKAGKVFWTCYGGSEKEVFGCYEEPYPSYYK